MRYGFRVHKLELARGLHGRRLLEARTSTNEREREDAKKGKGEERASKDYLEHLMGQLRQLESGPDTLTDVPKLIAVADGANEFVPGEEPGTPRLLVTDVGVHGRRVSVEVEYGHLGWHHRAVGKTRSDESPLADRSPMQRYRLEFLVPDKGPTGLIASETISGGHSLPMLVAWLNQLTREEMGDDDMVRLMAHPLTDLQRVLQLLEKPNSVAEIELKRTAGATVDGVHSSGTITLKEQVVPGNKIDLIKTLLQRWNAAGFKYDPTETREEVKALAEVVDPQAGDLEFTDGVIRLDPGGGKKLSVRPTKLGELYAYELSDLRPPQEKWESEVRDKLLGFAKDSELSVSWD